MINTVLSVSNRNYHMLGNKYRLISKLSLILYAKEMNEKEAESQVNQIFKFSNQIKSCHFHTMPLILFFISVHL